MKKALCVGLALAFAPMAVQAQSTTATVTATATVVANLTVAQLSILNFGELSQGDAPDVQVETAATAPQTRGEFQITHNSPVAISVNPPSVLTGPNSSTIGVSFECGLSSTQGGPTTGIADCALGTAPYTAGGANQDTFVLVGGAITAGTTDTAEPGTYSAVLTFSLTAVF